MFPISPYRAHALARLSRPWYSIPAPARPLCRTFAEWAARRGSRPVSSRNGCATKNPVRNPLPLPSGRVGRQLRKVSRLSAESPLPRTHRLRAVAVVVCQMSAGRVRVACTACATSKTRCDGERPCGRCVQRDMAAYCIDRPVHSMRPRERFRLPPGIACTPCKKSKVACAAVRPCPRCCQRFGDAAVVRCVDAPVVAAAPATEDPRRNLWPEKSSPLAMYRPVPKAISDALRDWCLQMDPRAIRRFLLSTPL